MDFVFPFALPVGTTTLRSRPLVSLGVEIPPLLPLAYTATVASAQISASYGVYSSFSSQGGFPLVLRGADLTSCRDLRPAVCLHCIGAPANCPKVRCLTSVFETVLSLALTGGIIDQRSGLLPLDQFLSTSFLPKTDCPLRCRVYEA